MKITSIEALDPVWEHRLWEGGHGTFIGTARFRIESDEPIFGSVVEDGDRRISTKGTPLYNALNEQFAGRVGGHPFEISDVKSETTFTASFRLGYSHDRPNESVCESCPNRDDCDDYDG